MNLEQRLMSKVDQSGECWTWNGYRTPRGHGYIWRDGKLVCAHRASYEVHVGQIPDGLVLDHLCRNPSCVNPAHLEPVTQQENCRRGDHSSKTPHTHCKRGHELTPDNSIARSDGRNRCRKCANAYHRIWRARKAKARGESQ